MTRKKPHARLSLVLSLSIGSGCGSTPDDAPTNGGDTPHGGDPTPGGDTEPESAFLDLWEAVDAAPQAEHQSMVDTWLAAHGPTFPYVEGELASFLYQGNMNDTVYLAGDMNVWEPQESPMGRLGSSNLFHITYVVPIDARLDYKYVVNGNWVFDPKNPLRVPSGFGENSELRMPEWEYPTEIDYVPGNPHGSVNGVGVAPQASYPPHTFHSFVLGNDRNVWTYLPPGYNSAMTYPLLIVNDGGEYIRLAQMGNVIDNLLAEGRIVPLVVVFVDPVDRGPEYVGTRVPQYVQLVVNELIPWIESNHAVSADPKQRGIMGTSNGGYISTRIVRDHPEALLLIGSQSAAIWADDGALVSSFANGSASKDGRIYVDTGWIGDMVLSNREFRDALQSGGYTHVYHEFPEGHSWGNWRGHLDNLLEFLFPAE